MPCGHGGFFSLCCLGRLRRGKCLGYARRALLKKVKQGLSFERRLLCPAGTEVFLFMLFGPPARRAADGGLLGAAAPPRPPLHSPRTTPLSLSSIPTPTGRPLRAFLFPSVHEGCTAFAPGASSLRSVISLRAAQCQCALSRCMRGRRASAWLHGVSKITVIVGEMFVVVGA